MYVPRPWLLHRVAMDYEAVMWWSFNSRLMGTILLPGIHDLFHHGRLQKPSARVVYS